MPFRPEAILLTTAEVASLLGIVASRVRQLTTSGHIEKRGKDSITLESAVKGYLRFHREEGHRTSKSASASRVQDARARDIELRTAEREGGLLEADDVLEKFAEWAGAVRAGFNALPARLTDDVEERSRIEAEIDDILAATTKGFRQRVGGDRPSDDGAADAASEDDA
jgi:hypothetical protein